MAQKSVQKHVSIIADADLFFNLLVSLGCNHKDDYSFFFVLDIIIIFVINMRVIL